jgi:hypothetical protein
MSIALAHLDIFSWRLSRSINSTSCKRRDHNNSAEGSRRPKKRRQRSLQRSFEMICHPGFRRMSVSNRQLGKSGKTLKWNDLPIVSYL